MKPEGDCFVAALLAMTEHNESRGAVPPPPAGEIARGASRRGEGDHSFDNARPPSMPLRFGDRLHPLHHALHGPPPPRRGGGSPSQLLRFWQCSYVKPAWGRAHAVLDIPVI